MQDAGSDQGRLVSNRGYDLRDFHLLAFGGAGPLHAAALARDLGMRGVLVPAFPGAFSALGLLLSDVRQDYVDLGADRASTRSTPEHVVDVFETPARCGARRDLLAQGFAPRAAALRVRLRSALRRPRLRADDPRPARSRARPRTSPRLRARFDDEHAQLTGHSAPDERVEIVNYRITAVAVVPQASIASPFTKTTDLAGATVGERDTYLGGERTRTTLYDRTKLAHGHRRSRPGDPAARRFDDARPPRSDGAWSSSSARSRSATKPPRGGGRPNRRSASCGMTLLRPTGRSIHGRRTASRAACTWRRR